MGGNVFIISFHANFSSLGEQSQHHFTKKQYWNPGSMWVGLESFRTWPQGPGPGLTKKKVVNLIDYVQEKSTPSEPPAGKTEALHRRAKQRSDRSRGIPPAIAKKAYYYKDNCHEKWYPTLKIFVYSSRLACISFSNNLFRTSGVTKLWDQPPHVCDWVATC